MTAAANWRTMISLPSTQCLIIMLPETLAELLDNPRLAAWAVKTFVPAVGQGCCCLWGHDVAFWRVCIFKAAQDHL